MDVNHLKSFLAVADTASFTKAAEGLFTTQPTLSRHISALEDELGVRLLERDRHSVRLTSAGKVLLEEGKRWIAAMITIERRVATADEGGNQKLEIICSPMYSQILRNIYQRFREDYPGVICNFRQVESGKELDVVKNRDTDIGVLFYRPEINGEMFRSFSISEEPLRLISGIDAPIAKRGALKMADFRNETLIIARTPMDDWLEGIHRSISHYFGRVIYVENLETVTLNIATNQGIAIWPEIVVKDTQNYSHTLNVPEFCEKTELYAVWLRENRNPLIERFKELCVKVPLRGIIGI